MKKIKFILSLILSFSILVPLHAKLEPLNPGDEGWLKAQHASCKDKYGFDDEIFQNCYKNNKAQYT